MLDIKKLLKHLSEAPGLSGYEHEVAAIIKDEFAELVDEIREDALGNVIALKKGEYDSGGGPRIMLAAHMDEIGLLVTKIEDEGCLRFATLGGFDPRVLVSQEVIVHAARPLPGVIGAKPPHLQEHEERKKSIKREDMFIDVGLAPEEARRLVRVGDPVSIRREVIHLGKNMVAGKAMDDRAGVVVLVECLKVLKKMRHRAQVYCVATVQEEVGIRGAVVSTYGIVPDIGIAIDVSQGDMLGVAEEASTVLDKGPAIGIGPHVHPRIYEELVRTAEERGIPYQVEPSPHPWGTDTWSIQVTRAGIPTGLVSVPTRYMHTSVETISLEDIKKTGLLMAEFVVRVDEEFLGGLKCF